MLKIIIKTLFSIIAIVVLIGILDNVLTRYGAAQGSVWGIATSLFNAAVEVVNDLFRDIRQAVPIA